jgi:hypothetical protein
MDASVLMVSTGRGVSRRLNFGRVGDAVLFGLDCFVWCWCSGTGECKASGEGWGAEAEV